MNAFYLLAGFVAVATAFTHAAWGERVIVPELKKSKMNELARAGFHIAWHQVTALLFAGGIALILVSMFAGVIGDMAAVLLVAFILFNNIIVFLTVSRLKYPKVTSRTLPPITNSIVMILLIIGGWFY
ncbi:hypothetical protein ACFPU1_04460 [Thalassorhabdus alkalitolerans]|uniref:DUF1304 domain-containing protein n=1 Tax=Thalassorhabdus alkalitolerans TaxID=2282697 RepID=A0ABW0YIS4_9BACI